MKRSIYQIAFFTLTICQIFGVPDVLRCLECHEVATPEACQNWVMCGQDEICFTREFRDNFGGKGYHQGCEDKARCDLFTNSQAIIGRRSTERAMSHMCYECCNSNDCNSIGCINATDCSDILKKNRYATDGIYTIDPGDGLGAFQVYCDMSTDEGGWVVIQRRMDGTENFYRTWNEYKIGFGSLSRQFYLGNEKIHRLSSRGATRLRVDLTDFEHNTAFATYNNFALGDISSNYKLSLGVYDGNAGYRRLRCKDAFGNWSPCIWDPFPLSSLRHGCRDSLTAQEGMGFSTKDKDVDSSPSHCAQIYHGAWWYSNCHNSNLNGDYNNTNYGQGINWHTWKGYYYSLYRTEMKLRPQH